MIIKIPTAIIIGCLLILFTKIAAIGAAITPPKIKPMITCQPSIPPKSMKVTPLAKETANSAAFTEPIVYRGFLPRPNKVDVTIGPQPPPPTASINPPKEARTLNRLVFFLMIMNQSQFC
mgnify:CR=1 FL=1